MMNEKFTTEKIEKDPKVKEFLRKKAGLRPRSIELYIFSIKRFCNFTGQTPTELYDSHRAELLKGVPVFAQSLNQDFDDYVAELISQGKAYNTISSMLTKVKGFFSAFKLTPPPTEISIKKVNEDAKYALKVEDIRKAIKYCSPNYQTLFITQAQTGLSLSDALLLDVEDFISAVSKKYEDLTLKQAIYRVKGDENIIGCFDLRRKKTSVEFYTFAGHETLHSIALLLEGREEAILKPEAPIFMKETYRLSSQRGGNSGSLEDLRLTQKAVDNYVGRMHTSKGIFPRIEVDGKERNYFRTHKLRKWFSNQLRFKAGFSAEDTKYLMGQKTGDVLEQYIDPNNYEALKGNYRKALPFLAITEEVVLEDNLEAIEQLKRESMIKDEKIMALEKRMELMDGMLKSMMENQLTV